MEILIVESDRTLAEEIRTQLKDAGYCCTCVFDGKEAADLLETRWFELILLEVDLPEVDGYELLEYIAPLQIPTILLTVKNSVEDRVKGLRLGADDYLIKPFEFPELIARVRAVLRRCYKGDVSLSCGDVTLNLQAHSVIQGDREIALTPKEFDLLAMFLQNKNIALLREVIFERVWHDEYLGDTRTVDLHVQRLRRKLHWKDRLRTVYKIGYRLQE